MNKEAAKLYGLGTMTATGFVLLVLGWGSGEAEMGFGGFVLLASGAAMLRRAFRQIKRYKGE